YPENSYIASVQWKKFKVLFGDFLIRQLETDNVSFREFCVLSQSARTQELNLVQMLGSEIDAGNYQTIVEEYKKISNTLGLDSFTEKATDQNELTHLRKLHM